MSSEIAEMYVGGQPLSELATGSLLPQAEFDSTAQVCLMHPQDSRMDKQSFARDEAIA